MNKSYYYEYMVNHLLHLDESEKEVRKNLRKDGLLEEEIDILFEDYRKALRLSQYYNNRQESIDKLTYELENQGWPHSAVVSIISKYEIHENNWMASMLDDINQTEPIEELSSSESKFIIIFICTIAFIFCLLWYITGLDLPDFSRITLEELLNAISIAPTKGLLKLLLLPFILLIPFCRKIIRKIKSKL